MSRATLHCTPVNATAIRRAALAKIETFTRRQCLDALAINQQFYLYLMDDSHGSSIRDMQLAIIEALEKGVINARDIDRLHGEDFRS